MEIGFEKEIESRIFRNTKKEKSMLTLNMRFLDLRQQG